MADGFDISVLGDKALSKALGKLPKASQRKAIRPALRKAAMGFRGHIVDNLSGFPVAPLTGRYRDGMRRVKITLDKAATRRGEIKYDVPYPTREVLGIPPGYEWFYPAALEYGTMRMPAKAPIRRAVNAHTPGVLARTTKDIARGIEKQWARLARR